jgi:hypothetical protein
VIREVNLIGHLPSCIQDFREIQGIMNAENPELQLVEDTSETVKNNMFILYTDEAGVKRYEKMFGLTASKNDGLSARQANVLAQYTNSVDYTYRGLVNRLNIMCGVGNYNLQMIPDKYLIAVELYPRVESLLGAVSSMLANMIPANMTYTCIILCNRHEVLSKYPIYLLEQFTHEEVYDLTIDDHISSTCDDIRNYTAENLQSIYCDHILNYGMRKV